MGNCRSKGTVPPHPNPLPGGEGTESLPPLPVGEGRDEGLSLSDESPPEQVALPVDHAVSTDATPTSLLGEEDEGARTLGSAPPPNGTRFTMMEFLPGNAAHMHRTDTVDYVICLSGEIAWGRLACADESPRRAPPGRATPIALVRREDLPWLLDATRGTGEPLGDRARLLLALLEQRGALFPHELRAQTGLSGRDLNGALWELVSGGRLTCDGFAARMRSTSGASSSELPIAVSAKISSRSRRRVPLAPNAAV